MKNITDSKKIDNQSLQEVNALKPYSTEGNGKPNIEAIDGTVSNHVGRNSPKEASPAERIRKAAIFKDALKHLRKKLEKQ